jgi:hypothetical protein
VGQFSVEIPGHVSAEINSDPNNSRLGMFNKNTFLRNHTTGALFAAWMSQSKPAQQIMNSYSMECIAPVRRAYSVEKLLHWEVAPYLVDPHSDFLKFELRHKAQSDFYII